MITANHNGTTVFLRQPTPKSRTLPDSVYKSKGLVRCSNVTRRITQTIAADTTRIPPLPFKGIYFYKENDWNSLCRADLTLQRPFFLFVYQNADGDRPEHHPHAIDGGDALQHRPTEGDAVGGGGHEGRHDEPGQRHGRANARVKMSCTKMKKDPAAVEHERAVDVFHEVVSFDIPAGVNFLTDFF